MNKKLTCRRLFNIYGHTGGSYAGNVYDPDGVCPALNTMGGGNREPLIIEDVTMKKTKKQSSLQLDLFEDSPYRPVWNADSGDGGSSKLRNLLPEELRDKTFRVRRTTPSEWFRLQGVEDKDIQTLLQAGISKTSLALLAGNAIVVDVLFHLFRKMFIETGPEYENGEQMQML